MKKIDYSSTTIKLGIIFALVLLFLIPISLINNLIYENELEDLRKFQAKFNEKVIYSAQVDIVQFHHCILHVEGENI